MNRIALAAALTTVLFVALAPWAAGQSHGHRRPSASKAKPVSDPGWRPDPALLAHLQPSRTFGHYRMRLPVGYTLETRDASTAHVDLTQYMVKGPKHADGSFPVLLVLSGDALPGYRTFDPDPILDDNKGLQAKPDLVKSERERGRLNGLTVAREYFKFSSDVKGVTPPIHGFAYATADGATEALVMAFDEEPTNKTTLKLAEASALTLSKAR